jgi:hypothetical protein
MTFIIRQLTAGGERSMNRVEVDVIDGVYKRLVLGVWSRITTMAFERKVIPAVEYERLENVVQQNKRDISRSVFVLYISWRKKYEHLHS